MSDADLGMKIQQPRRRSVPGCRRRRTTTVLAVTALQDAGALARRGAAHPVMVKEQKRS
jgi:hypothetical protein